MRRQTPISVLLYNHLYPRPSSTDPQNFSAYLAKHLIPEIRIETARFYGSLDTIEARYPGLNYTHPPHIVRLSRFSNHARLFKAFRSLRLTDNEILDLVRWEGTIWARERFERDEGITVADTTADGIKPWVPHSQRKPVAPKSGIKKAISLVITGEEVVSIPTSPVDSAAPSLSLTFAEGIVSESECSSDEEEECDEEDEEDDQDNDDEDDDIQHEDEAARDENAVRSGTVLIRPAPAALTITASAERLRSDREDEEPVQRSRLNPEARLEVNRRVMMALANHQEAQRRHRDFASIHPTAAADLDSAIEDYLKEQSEDGTLPHTGDSISSGRSIASLLNTASSIRASEEVPTITQPA